MVDITNTDLSDDADLARCNYKPELRRRLGPLGSIAVAYSLISITMGIFSNYGYALSTAGPAGIWTWVFVAIGQTFVAMIFAEMAGRIPLSGYSYQWVGRLGGRGLGWFTGWVALCNMIITIPAVNGMRISELSRTGSDPRTTPVARLPLEGTQTGVDRPTRRLVMERASIRRQKSASAITDQAEARINGQLARAVPEITNGPAALSWRVPSVLAVSASSDQSCR